MSFHNKYLKYKSKYLDLKNKITQKGGSAISHKCNYCDDDCNSNITCPECKSVYYCSVDCKRFDKQHHLKLCGKPSPSSVATTVKPSPSSVVTTVKHPEGGGGASTSTSATSIESEFRKAIAKIVLKSYNELNMSYDFPPRHISTIKFKYENWHRYSVDPDPTLPEKIKEIYTRLNSRPKPRFNLTREELDVAFTFNKPPHPSQVLECASAMYMVNMNIFYKFMPNCFQRLFDISVLDRMLENPENNGTFDVIKGYDEKFQLYKLKSWYKHGILLESDLIDINKVLLDETKAKRLYMIDLVIRQILLNVPDKSSEIKIGNTYYIHGHPDYNPSWGENAGEYVICVDINSNKEPLFIGFTGNRQFSGPSSFSFDRPLTLIEIQIGLTRGFINAFKKLITHDLGTDFEELLKMTCTRSIEHIYDLNIENIINEKRLSETLPPKRPIDPIQIQNQEILKYPNNADLVALIKEP